MKPIIEEIKQVNYEDAISIMYELLKETEDVGIFMDAGWGG